MLATAPLRPDCPVDDAERMVVEVEEIPVGPELAAALLELRDGQPGGLGDAHLQARVAACWSALASWCEAQALDAVAAGAMVADEQEADGSPYAGMGFTTDLALAARQGEGWAARQIDLAAALLDRLPVTRLLLDAGRLSVRHAAALVRALEHVTDDDLARKVDGRLAGRAAERGWTPAELAAAARRLLLRLDPDGGADRHENALDREADVTAGAGSDGLGWLQATGDLVTVGEILSAVDERARQLQQLTPDTPIGRVRFAALGDLVLGQEFTLFEHAMGREIPAEARVGASAEPDQDPVGSRSPADRARRSRRFELIVTIAHPARLAGAPGRTRRLRPGPGPDRAAAARGRDAAPHGDRPGHR